MDERGKSDNSVVPAKPPNKAGRPVAEVVEGRGLAEGNTDSSTRPGRSAGPGVSSGLDRVREVARKDKEARFTALLHHVDLPRLWAAYAAINPKAASGVDQVTWDAYGQNLRANLEDLLGRVHSGAYRASPSRRVYIRSRTDGSARSASPRWRTRSSNGRWSRCGTPSTRRTFSASPTGSCVPNRKGA
jgi:RNA-directed DNA polymerase